MSWELVETSSPTRWEWANNVRQPGINSTSLHIGDERVKLGNKWHYVSNYFFPLLMLKEEQLDETFIKLCIAQRGWQTWLYYSLHQRHFQSSFFFYSPWKWKATVDVANKLLIQRPPRIQAGAVMAGLWWLVGLESSDSPWTASRGACGRRRWASGCCWRSCAAARRAPPSLCWGWPPSERRGWKHTAPDRKHETPRVKIYRKKQKYKKINKFSDIYFEQIWILSLNIQWFDKKNW